MRQYIVAAAAAVAAIMTAGTALAADTATHNITLTGTMPDTCNIPTAPTTAASTNMTLNGGATTSASTVNVSNIFNTTTGALTGGSITLRFASAVCNYNATVSLQTTNGRLTRSGGTAVVAGTWLTAVDYSAVASWATFTSSTLNATGTAGAKINSTIGGPVVGNLDVQITVASSATPVAGGTYDDVLVLQIGTAL